MRFAERCIDGDGGLVALGECSAVGITLKRPGQIFGFVGIADTPEHLIPLVEVLIHPDVKLINGIAQVGSLVKLSNKPGPFGLGNKSSSFTALGSIRDEGIWFPVKGSRAKPMALPEGVPLGHGGVIPLVGSGTPQKIVRVVAGSKTEPSGNDRPRTSVCVPLWPAINSERSV